MTIDYTELLEKAASGYDTFSLVWREGLKFNDSALDIERKLAPFIKKEIITDEWPGTKIFKAKALVRFYTINNDSLNILREVENIFDWLAPFYPEDLAFYKNGKVKFTSIAHEGDAWYA